MIYLSASQISTYRDCARKWAWRYIAGVESPQHPAAALGTEVDDEQIQPYLRGEREGFDYTRDSGYIAASMLAYLPQPKTVEVQHYFAIPSPTWVTVDGKREHIGFGFQGYADLWAADSAMLGCPGGAPGVGDTKTTSDLKWAKTEKQLSVDVQAMLYATAAMFETGARVVDLAWIYGQTRGARKAKRTYLRVVGGHVAEQFGQINETALAMLDVRKSDAGPLDLPPNPDMCEAYGGCPYRDKCNLSPIQIIEAHAAKAARQQQTTSEGLNMGSTADMLAALKAKKAAQGAGSVGAQDAPAAPTTPAPAAADAAPVAPPSSPPVSEPPAPAGLPSWATAPVDPLKAAHAAGKAYVGINPPESALPPAPPVGTSDGAEPAKKRGRPAKAAPAPAEPAAEPTTARTVRVTWGAERISPVPYNHFDVGPFEVVDEVRPGETTAQAVSRVHAELAELAERVRVKKAQSFAAAIGGGK